MGCAKVEQKNLCTRLQSLIIYDSDECMLHFRSNALAAYIGTYLTYLNSNVVLSIQMRSKNELVC